MKKTYSATGRNFFYHECIFTNRNIGIASFVAPQGGQRIDSNGKLGFFDAKEMNGATKFCQILLYPSRASSGNALNDFTNEWNSHIPKATGWNIFCETSSTNKISKTICFDNIVLSAHALTEK